VVERTGGGVLVEPDNADSLAEMLFELWSDRPRLEALGRRAFAEVRAHYSIERSADRLLEAYRGMTGAHA
jgi:glycosyltransferase involved in cell wall biosynthesis